DLLRRVRAKTIGLAELNRQQVETIAQEVAADHRLAYEAVRNDLVQMGIKFVTKAKADYQAKQKRTLLAMKDTSLFSYEEEVPNTLRKVFGEKGRLLHRKSVQVGNQSYYLVAKAIQEDKVDFERYIFNLYRSSKKQHYFEMEGVRATASTINAMAKKMKRGLQKLKPTRNRQLSQGQLERIAEIADRLERNPADYGPQDDDFLETTIENAADQYGFSAQTLRRELQSTGIFGAIQRRNEFMKTTSSGLRPLDLDRKINNGAIAYTRFNGDLDQELRDIAADFLFTAYQRSIVVEADSTYIIGTLKVRDSINFYRRGLTYEEYGTERDRKQRKGKYIPLGKVKFNEVQIEFENEQINNIELTGTKIDTAAYIPAISHEQEVIYVDVEGRSYPVLLEDEEYSVDQAGTIKVKKRKDKFIVSKQPVYNDENSFVGNIYFFGANFTGRNYKANGEKRKQDFTREFSFDFYMFMDVRLPTSAELGDSVLLKKYLANFLDGDRPKAREVVFYIDKEKEQELVRFKVVPNITLGTKTSAKFNTDKNTMDITYVGDKYENSWDTIASLGLIEKVQDRINNAYTIEAGEDETVVYVRGLVSNFLKLTSASEKISDVMEKGEELVFQNLYPISYSTKEDIKYTRASGKPKREKRLYLADNEHFVLLSEVLNNKLVFYNRTENYSPQDGVIRINPKNNVKGVPIYKENTKDILKARIYSDFIGFDENNPNGLVQTEVSKRFFLNTSSTSSFQNFMYSGYFNFIEPNLVIAKIEENNKYLQLKEFAPLNPLPQEGETLNYASSLDILNYSTLQVGGLLGLAYFSFPKYHIRLQFGVGGHIFQSGFANERITQDTAFNVRVQTENEFIANSLVYYPDIRMEFNPDPRFGLEVAYRPTYVTLLNNDVLQVDNEERFLASDGRIRTDKVVHVVQLLANIRVNKETNGQFFFRTNFSLSGDDRNNNFLQAQLGYAFNIFSRTEGRARSGPPPAPSANTPPAGQEE
ncbi:MAG: hypothetical protein AAFZ52_11070, partial [Bacteroidota bacterium]